MMKTKQILDIMKVVSWIIFIGLCINTGVALISFMISILLNPEAAQNLYSEFYLPELFEKNIRDYVNIMSFIIVLSGLKAYIFYLVIRIFSKIDFDRPFNDTTVSLISKISHTALGIGLVSLAAQGYSKWLLNRGFYVEQNWGSSDFLFLAGIIYVIALIFKRGVEIQSENELTI